MFANIVMNAMHFLMKKMYIQRKCTFNTNKSSRKKFQIITLFSAWSSSLETHMKYLIFTIWLSTCDLRCYITNSTAMEICKTKEARINVSEGQKCTIIQIFRSKSLFSCNKTQLFANTHKIFDFHHLALIVFSMLIQNIWSIKIDWWNWCTMLSLIT